MTDSPTHVAVPSRLRTLKRHTPRFMKRTVRKIVRGYGRYTAHRRVLPDFLVIGAKRAGTTSLWNWLVAHPDVAPLFPAVQQIKSPHYFDIHFDRGIDWYRSFFPTRSTLREGMVCGEASPYYLFHPEVPARVAATVADVKLLVVLRDPVRRAYSHFWERRGGGHEPLESFAAALDAEPKRMADAKQKLTANPLSYVSDHDNFSYLARGHYAEQLERWFSVIGRDQFHILIFEELVASEHATMRGVEDFLGIGAAALPPKPPRYNTLPAPKMSPDDRERLQQYYDPWNTRLEELLNRDLPW